MSSGQRFSYTTIVDHLTQCRKEKDKKLADCARNYYGEEFKNLFSYKKRGVVFVKTKDADIAKQFQQELLKKSLPIEHIVDYNNSDMDLD